MSPDLLGLLQRSPSRIPQACHFAGYPHPGDPRERGDPDGSPPSTAPNQIFDTYRITRATGAYKKVTGFGVVEFDFLP